MLIDASEGFATLRELFDCIDWAGLLELLPQDSCSWVLPMDMKTGAYALGVGSSGSTHPYPYNLWSPFTKYSRPDVERTMESICEQHRLCTIAQETWTGDPRDIFAKFHSVHAAPIQLLQLLCRDRPITEVLVPPPLHLMLGIATTLFDHLCLIDVTCAYSWLEEIGVRATRTSTATRPSSGSTAA